MHESEVLRVQQHIAGAEALLSARSTEALSLIQQLTRGLLHRELARYRARGVFPKNRDFSDERRPYFIDADGTRCAMAHLMEIGGAGDLVAEIAATNNNAYVAELAADERFRAWLDAAGLTVEEAARIQPAYDWVCAAPEACLCISARPSSSFVWEGTVFEPDPIVILPNAKKAWARIDAIYGSDPKVVEVGAVVDVPRVAVPGARVLGIARIASSGDGGDAGAPVVSYELVSVVGDDGVVGPECLRQSDDGYRMLSVGLLTPAEAAPLILSPGDVCRAELAKTHACWASYDCKTGGCSPDALERAARAAADVGADAGAASAPAQITAAKPATPRTGGCQSSSAAPTSIGILLAILGALAVRRTRERQVTPSRSLSTPRSFRAP
jgi:MYXO-CTERM domain-containing protein